MVDLSKLTVVELEALEIQVSLELLDRACGDISSILAENCLETEIEPGVAEQSAKDEFRAYRGCV